MSVKVRERVYPETNTVTWQADIHVKLLDGRRVRERCRVPGATSHATALKWARERERWLILHGHEREEETQEPQATPTVPTLAEFCRRWMTEYVIANRLKPSTISNKKILIRNYLVPALGELRLDEISESEIQRLKTRFVDHKPSSVNNILTCLSTILKSAIEWQVIDAMPRVRKLKKQPQRFEFYDEATYEHLVECTEHTDPRSRLVVLLGGDAGLRAGEMLALRWEHCDLDRGVLRVEENAWCGHVGTPKGNRSRQVVMTDRLRDALAEHRREHGRDVLVLVRDSGEPASKRVLDGWLLVAQRTAALPKKGPHILRHTFCSRLAARGAAPKAIQELAGHVHSSTTDRYLHLAPSALHTAIGLLNPSTARSVGAKSSRREPRHGRGTSASARQEVL
ncbi:MAG: site-specific integrase [Myxococcales bacterium]|nr:site-specific integrase [Myxococcales bacterium]